MLPFPPSINDYYADIPVNNGKFKIGKQVVKIASYHQRDKRKSKALNKRANKFFRDAYYLIKQQCGCTTKLHGLVKVAYIICPPDNRKHDTGNLRKALDDALWKSKLIKDDNDGVEFSEKKIAPKKPGWVKVTVEEL